MSTKDDPLATFGPNEWLVEEMYQQYQQDPSSVDAAWHDFFADYRRPGGGPNGAGPDRSGPARSADRTARRTAEPAAEPTAAEPAAEPTAAEPTAAEPTTAEPSSAGPPAQPPAQPTAAASGGQIASPAEASPRQPTGGPGPARPTSPGQATAGQTPPGQTTPEQATAGQTTPGQATPLRGAAARVVANMAASLSIPTATSVRAVPAKLIADNRVVINNHLRRARGGKVSFTHLIGYALVRALADHPEMNNSYAEVAGRATLVVPEQINLGLAIDLARPDGSRSLVVAAIKECERMDFARFWSAYEDIIRRARANKLTVDDFTGTTISLTNPGGIGTVHSVPRLMAGQGAIIGVGAMEYPAEFAGMSEEALARNAVSKVITLTSTYDHRIIQGAQSGEFLGRMHELLLGADGFYDDVFRALHIPYEPVRWVRDVTVAHEGEIDKEARVLELIHSYRVRGHLMADTDPLEFKQRNHPDLDILNHGLTLWDLDREFPVGGFAGERVLRLRDILGVLRDAYCRTVGVEYMHIQDPEQRRWIQARVETRHDKPDPAEQKHILGRLNAAEAFETFLQTKYVGQKRFSLEGAESVIPLLDAVLSCAARDGLDEVVLGMPHRGRLNVLANIVGKSYAQIFREFDGNIDPGTTHGSGDVKYHLGAKGTFRAAGGGDVAVSLTSNPSHLEAVDPVLEGIVRAKQDLIDKGEAGFTVLPVLLHGDAAFAGQGVVAETLNLSQLRGYRTGGTVHVVVNNQVGFTTSPEASRSSVYCTDVARMIQAPIFHVNGDDPEACVRVAKLAYAFRRDFKKDVVIDMVCYRRRGHNEADDPSMTQPLMYDTIDRKRSVRKLYTEALVGRGDISLDEAEEALRDFREHLERAFVSTRDSTGRTETEETLPETTGAAVTTAIDRSVLKRVTDAQVSWPDGFVVHKRLKRQLERRAAMSGEEPVDWATAELIAFGSLLLEGRPVRLSGQDSRRGTFVQRHAVLVDRETGREFTPLRHLDPAQAPFWVYDSLLSEFAAMGFEYGYSVANQRALVLWEAQFGDFANGGQSIVDEFISSGEAKWGQRSGLVLLLPHGYEGQGPDHSSARVERYLQLCAEGNITVAMPSSPANYFHLLRRQALSPTRRPLIVFTPKSLLRHREATSPAEDFADGAFQPVLDDPLLATGQLDPAAVRRVMLCAGKFYYDLAQARAQRSDTATAILRLEQFYPLPVDRLTGLLGRFPAAERLVWVQEEPANQGAWPFVALNLPPHLPGAGRLDRVSRKAAASPAAGQSSVHEAEQAALISAAFAD